MPVVSTNINILALQTGEKLFHEGDKNDGNMYVVRSGRFAVLKHRQDGSQIVSELTSGDVIGEVSFFSGESRTATVKALERSSLFVLSTETFEQMVLRNPEIGLKIIRGLVSALRSSEKRAGWR